MFYFMNNMSQVNYQPMPIGVEEDGDGPFIKRCKTSSSSSLHHSNQNWSSRSIQFPVSPAQYNPLDEPSPLGLKLRKSPSLLDLIQMKLSGTNASYAGTAPGENSQVEKKKDVKASAASSSIDKLKASNFLASFLKIGSWEYVSKRKGDLVAKCYYSKNKLVWEVLDGGLKSKIEIQWSDIVALNASYPDDKPGNLTIVLSRPPLFFKESDPQPRKHTLWQATADFTNGQASMHRQHFLQCPQGVLNKHYEKLIQCDMRLKCLSQQPDIVGHAPYFVSLARSSEGDISRYQVANQHGTAKVCPISSVQSVALPSSASLKVEQMGTLGIAPLHRLKEASSPSSGALKANVVCEGHNFLGLNSQKQSKVQGLHQSLSVNDLVNHISEQMTSEKRSECKDTLDNIAHHLFNDTQTITVLDEKSLMSRDNSLRSLLHIVDSSDQLNRETSMNGKTEFEQKSMCDSTPASMFEIGTMFHEEEDITNITSYKYQPNMPRKDSFGDFLHQFSRIGSIPDFLHYTSVDGDNHTYW